MKPSLITRLLKSLLRIIGILLLIAVVLVGVIDWQGRGQLDEFCSNARPGTSLSELSEQARRGEFACVCRVWKSVKNAGEHLPCSRPCAMNFAKSSTMVERVLAVKRNSLD
ncbi:MAG: hypothetical protein IPH08_00025 [Rhodocyclaceae bacterium]|nr:hypothetical protein [Rhodocyclaceae bacterium]